MICFNFDRTEPAVDDGLVECLDLFELKNAEDYGFGSYILVSFSGLYGLRESECPILPYKSKESLFFLPKSECLLAFLIFIPLLFLEIFC